jgi:hypothetical protein
VNDVLDLAKLREGTLVLRPVQVCCGVDHWVRLRVKACLDASHSDRLACPADVDPCRRTWSVCCRTLWRATRPWQRRVCTCSRVWRRLCLRSL